jgi:GTP-binding protein
LLEIAVAGKSNVGKSSLLNRLTGQKGLAKTSSTPGKTQCLNFFRVQPEKGRSFNLVDLPGYGYAKVSQSKRDEWGRLIEGYLALSDRPAGIIALFDARREPTDVDREWLAWLDQWQRPYLVVLTKSDKLSGNEKVAAVRRWSVAETGPVVPLLTSAVEGIGLERIWQWISEVQAGKRQRR